MSLAPVAQSPMATPRSLTPDLNSIISGGGDVSREAQLTTQFMQAELNRQSAHIKRQFELMKKEVQLQIEERVHKEMSRQLMPINAELAILRQELSKLKQRSRSMEREGSQKERLQSMSAMRFDAINENFAAVQMQVATLEQNVRLAGSASPGSYPTSPGQVNSEPIPQTVPLQVAANRAPLSLPQKAASLRGIGGDLGPAVRSIESEAINPDKVVGQDEFIFVADPRKGQTLGLHVIARNDNDTVEVAGVLDQGLAMQWNAANPRLAITIGDQIMAVNGVKGSSSRILSQLRLKDELRLHIKRSA